MLQVTYTGPHQQKDLFLPDGSKLRLVRKVMRDDVSPNHKDFLREQADVTVVDTEELSRDMLL